MQLINRVEENGGITMQDSDDRDGLPRVSPDEPISVRECFLIFAIMLTICLGSYGVWKALRNPSPVPACGEASPSTMTR